MTKLLIMQKISNLIFGVRTQGERLPVPPPIKERPFNSEDFQKWCKELRVSMLHDKKVVHFN
jgi:hypothetical protein